MSDGVQGYLDAKYCAGKWCICDCGSNTRLVNLKEDNTGLFPSECDNCGKTWSTRDGEWAAESTKLLSDEAATVKEFELKKKDEENKEAKNKDAFPDVAEIDGCSVTVLQTFEWVRRAYDNDPTKWDAATCGGPTPKDAIFIFCSSYTLLEKEAKTKALNYIRNKPHDEVIDGLKDILKLFHDEAPLFASLATKPP
jgi:hypothetical protein